MKINITYTGPNPQRVHYVLGFIQGHPFMPRHVRLAMNSWSDSDIRIDYTARDIPLELNEYYIPSQEQVFATAKKSSTWQSNEYTFANRKLYSVEQIKAPNSVFIEERKFGFDIFETIFFHLTRHEEYYCDASFKDQWDIMIEEHHFLVRNDLYQQPIVDNIVESLLLAIGLVPETFKSKLTITHDIDVLRKFDNTKKSLRAFAGDVKRNKSLKSLAKIYSLYKDINAGNKKDPYDTFDQLFVKENHRKIVYFMAGGTSDNDEKYEVETELFKSIVNLAKSRDYQIGIHPSYNSFEDYVMITEERNKLQDAIGGKIRTSRQHFLRFSFEETITALSDSGIYEDSTLGYQHRVGYRCGTAFTFLLFDLRRDRNSKVSETPMIIMDGALLDQCKDDVAQANALLMDFIERHKQNSHLTINFHNTIFDPTRYDKEAMWKMYYSIIEKYN
ncbi:hypothetical protein N9Q69_00695 [bacterium]|nr:hypothetical protein [bacterium]